MHGLLRGLIEGQTAEATAGNGIGRAGVGNGGQRDGAARLQERQQHLLLGVGFDADRTSGAIDADDDARRIKFDVAAGQLRDHPLAHLGGDRLVTEGAFLDEGRAIERSAVAQILNEGLVRREARCLDAGRNESGYDGAEHDERHAHVAGATRKNRFQSALKRHREVPMPLPPRPESDGSVLHGENWRPV
ncbi:MAG: hypothetical protein IPL47_15730 [Phyllobacteriaceae bacterium]|nr:hypothetical protein [Phyllobacteriaceae bacterium]